MLRQKWWKIMGGLIMLYVLIGGMITPLKPGIIDVDKIQVKSGELVEFRIKGYNTHFSDAKKNKVYLKLDSEHLIEANDVRPSTATELIAQFQIPNDLPTNKEFKWATMISTNEIDGSAILTNAVSIKRQGDTDGSLWNDKIDRSELKDTKVFGFPFRSILYETIRNTFFHVALWMAMFALLMAGLYYGIKYLRTKDLDADKRSAAFNRAAILYGILGLITGSIWAKVTWGTWWTTDVKLNMSAIAMLIYSAYIVLRASSTDFEKRARLSSAYSIFAFAALVPLVLIIPRMTDSLHPGNGGNPALGGEDLDNTLRMFFYPSIIGLVMLGCWIASLVYRSDVLESKVMSEDL